MNRIDSNRLLLYESTRSRFDFVEKYHAALGSIGKPRIFLQILCERKKQHLTEHPADKYRGGPDKSDVVHHRVLTANGLFVFMASQASKLSLSASLEWAEETIERHPRDNDDDAAIEVVEFSFLVLGRSRASLRALPIELVGKNCLRPPGFLLRSLGRSTLCYDMHLLARLLPRLPPVEVHDL